MSRGLYHVPKAYNEAVKEYAPGSAERKELKAMISKMRSEVVDIPMFIGGKEVRTNDIRSIHPPHDHQHLLGHYHYGTASSCSDSDILI